MQPQPESTFERFCVWLETLLKDRKNPDGSMAKFSRRFRWALTAATIAYFLFLIVMLFLLDWWGERHWLLSILLYVPAAVWFVPLVLLTPLHLIFRPRLVGITGVAAVLLAFVYLDFNWSFSNLRSANGLLVATSNIGERDFSALISFLETENPDVIALQDGWHVRDVMKAKYPERFVSGMGEYVLTSKYPIKKSALLSLSYGGRAIGARHEIDYLGKSVVIYNIHMPTPRPEFMKLRGRGFLAEAIGGGGIYSPKVRKSYSDFLAAKLELSRGLIEVLEKETRPFFVVGDFNMPANGYVSGLFQSRLADAFDKKGRGYGFTFPSSSLNPLSFFGPWLRLDYLFADKHNWQPKYCRIEGCHPGQHRAAVAQFEMQEQE